MRDSTADLVQPVLKAATTTAWVALPDYVEGRFRRGLVRAVLATGSVAVLVAIDANRDSRRHNEAEPTPEPGGDSVGEEEPVSRTSAVLTATGVGTTVISLVTSRRVSTFLADRLRDRGVTRPHTALGLAAGGLSLVLDVVEERFG